MFFIEQRLNVRRRLTISYALLCCSYRNIFMLIRKCGSVFRLCFALYHFHYDFSFLFFFCFCFFLVLSSVLCCVVFFSLQIACYLVSPTPYFRFMRHLPDEHTHIIFCYTMNSEEHQMDSNTNVLSQLPSANTTTSATIKNEISVFFSSNVYQRKNVLRV